MLLKLETFCPGTLCPGLFLTGYHTFLVPPYMSKYPCHSVHVGHGMSNHRVNVGHGMSNHRVNVGHGMSNHRVNAAAIELLYVFAYHFCHFGVSLRVHFFSLMLCSVILYMTWRRAALWISFTALPLLPIHVLYKYGYQLLLAVQIEQRIGTRTPQLLWLRQRQSKTCKICF